MRCRRVLPAFLLAVFFAAAPARAALITLESRTVDQGADFLLGIFVSDVTNLWAFQFDVSFTSGVLSATDTIGGPLLSFGGTPVFPPSFVPGEPPDDPDFTPPGSIRFVAGSLSGFDPGVSVAPGAPNLFPLAYIAFTATGAGSAIVNLSNITLLNLIDDNLTDIEEIEVNSGTVTVVPTASVPEPATLVLMGVGLLTMARGLRRRV